MKDKLINILLIAILFTLILSLFNSNDKNNLNQNIKTNIDFISQKNSYTIPAWVKLSVINNTNEVFNFNTCQDLDIKFWSQKIDFSNCEDISVDSGNTYNLDFSKDYDKFFTTGRYIATLWETPVVFDIKNKWFFNKFFSFFFYAPVYNLMAFLLVITAYSLGWAIILVTIIIRIILLVPQHKMMISQRKLQAIQPKIKEIQSKHKWNHQVLWVELMKLYKQEKVNPMWSCGLLLIQMPILIVIYHIIISIQSHQNMYYMYSFLPEFQVDKITQFFFWFDLIGIWAWVLISDGFLLALPYIILSLVVWGLQFLQVKLSLSYNKKDEKWVVLEKKKDAKDYNSFMPDPEFLNKFMLYWLPIMITIFTFSFFAWVWVYWAIWTIFMIFQQLIVNKIIKK